MKRRTLKLLLFLLAGAIINVAVAWGCAIQHPISDLRKQNYKYLDDAEKQQFGFIPTQWRTYDRVQLTVTTSLGCQSTVAAEIPADFTLSDQRRWLKMYCAGFPFYSLSGEERLNVTGRLASESERDRLTDRRRVFYMTIPATVDGQRTPLRRYLPCCPIWPGFAINTIFYAGVLWVLFAVPMKFRRWRRIKRGVCMRCAYPVGSSSVCSECGTAVHGASPPATPA